MHIKNILIAASAAILAACATATPYQAASEKSYDGYSSQQIENNRFNVSFAGNSLTDKETVETYLLHRAAELAVENGYDYFSVANEDTERNTRIVSTPSYYGSGFGSGFGGSSFRRGFYTSYDYYHPRYGWSSSFGSRGFSNGFSSGFGGRIGSGIDIREITRFKANAQIILGRGNKPEAENAFDARQVLANVGPALVYPEVKS